MSKILATSISRNGKDITFHTELSEYYMNLLMNEISKYEKLEVSIKQYKSNRTKQQNDLMWKVISLISDEQNGSHREEDIMNVYVNLLHKANVKPVILAAVQTAKPILESQFRYVQELPNTMTTDKGITLVLFKCYVGSSQYDVKEMSELITALLDYAAEVGVVGTDVEMLRSEIK